MNVFEHCCEIMQTVVRAEQLLAAKRQHPAHAEFVQATEQIERLLKQVVRQRDSLGKLLKHNLLS